MTSPLGQPPVDLSSCPWPSAEVTQCPWPFYEALRDEAPVYRLPGTDDVIVSRWEDIAYIVQHPEKFSNQLFQSGDSRINAAAWVTESEDGGDTRRTPYSMASTDPPEHRLKRALGLRLVTHEKLRSYEPLVRALANELIDRWIDNGECDFSNEFANLVPIEVICDILGLPREDVLRLQRLGDVEAGGAMRFASAERVAADAEKTHEMMGYMRAALLERIERPTDDFLSELVAAQIEQDGTLDLDYLINEGTLLLFAGNVTTAHLIASMMVSLCRDPSLVETLRGNDAGLKQLVEEVLRLEAPVQWVQRIAVEDLELGGVHVPKGAWVLIFLGSGNRDERRFADPTQLDLGRKTVAKHQLAFGRGIHLCLGAPLARLEGRICFEVLLERLDGMRLVEAKSDLRNLESVRFRAPQRVWIEFDAR